MLMRINPIYYHTNTGNVIPTTRLDTVYIEHRNIVSITYCCGDKIACINLNNNTSYTINQAEAEELIRFINTSDYRL